MKTAIEVEQMKSDIEKKISALQKDKMECFDVLTITRIHNQIMQLRAQYNILLEVLK